MSEVKNVVQIRNRHGVVLREVEADDLRAALESAVRYGANLYGANLDGANLVRANLYGAHLYGANLEGANLYGAHLYGANLEGANLDGANLVRANLYGANLDGANLDDDTIMPHGETWLQYQQEVVPALLRAGGKEIAAILQSGCWTCHSWQNCPMHTALDIESDSSAPLLIRPRVKEFVQYFDAKLLDGWPARFGAEHGVTV